MRLHTVGSLRYVLARSLLTFVGFIIAVTRIECVLIVGAESRDNARRDYSLRKPSTGAPCQ